MRRECNIKVYEGSNAVIIEISGDLTASADKDMHAAYREACGYNPSNIVLKFGDKTHINSSGIAVVISLVIESREKGYKIFVSGLSRDYRKIFDMTGLTRYTTIVESEDEIIKKSERTDDT
jgi:anti-sigma B factor antagonist